MCSKNWLFRWLITGEHKILEKRKYQAEIPTLKKQYFMFSVEAFFVS